MQLLVTMSSSHHEPHGSNYGNTSWTGFGNYTHTESQHHGGQAAVDYQPYEYIPSAPIPLEPSYPMNRPPPYAAPQHAQMPPPLVMPQQHIWPSMLATSAPTPYQQPILPAVSVQTPLSATSMSSDLTPTSAKGNSSRRKLTDEERRLMCLEAEKNPTMKQTQIGAKFNVERSTVSKILRHKDKYMKPPPSKDEHNSPGKKTKVKLPDVEKTLANWARNQHKRGQSVTIDELRKQVLMFTSGRTDQEAFTTTEWLEDFHRKYLSTSKSRETTVDTSTSRSETLDSSPTSSNGLVSPPISAIEDTDHMQLKMKKREDFFDFETGSYEDSPTLPHGFTSMDAPLSPDAVVSPTSSRTHYDYVTSPIADDLGLDTSIPRQRSMTMSHIAAASSDNNFHALPVRSTTSVNYIKSGSIDPRQTMKRHKSVPDIHDTEVVRFSTMQPPPLPRSADISPVSVPGSPVQDETIVALHNIKKLLEQRPDVAEPDDYVMIGKLMEKLKLLRTRSPSATPILPGGMYAMDVAGSPRISKKRTMVEMSS